MKTNKTYIIFNCSDFNGFKCTFIDKIYEEEYEKTWAKENPLMLINVSGTYIERHINRFCLFESK